MSNPHPKKQTRNGSVHTDSARGVLNMTSDYVPRQRQLNEAMPRTISPMEQPIYKPPVWVAPIR
jgi:hypothetical protein